MFYTQSATTTSFFENWTSSQSNWYLFQLVIPPVGVPSRFPWYGHCTRWLLITSRF